MEQASAIKTISNELSKLAVEIEDLPQCDCQQLSNEQIMRMQQIDFCSQRLQDLSTLIAHLDGQLETGDPALKKSMAAKARLEHTRNLFQV